MLLDNVVHAFGSVSHDTLCSVLLSAGVHRTLTEHILYAVQHLILGGHHGVCLFCAMYEAGMGQRDPFSALLYCLVNDLRLQLVLITSPGAPFRNLGWVDDSSWIGTLCQDIQQVAFSLPLARDLPNLFSEATKTIGLGTSMRGIRVISTDNPFISRACPYVCWQMGSIYVSWASMLCHVFPKQDLRKLMASCRTAVTPVSMCPARPLSGAHVQRHCWGHTAVELCGASASPLCNVACQIDCSVPPPKILGYLC